MSENKHAESDIGSDIALARTRDGAEGSSRRQSAASRKKAAAPKTTEPLISIILFVRNGMPQLRRAVQSVLAQDYGNFEYVIQDGGSTDGTLEYLKSVDDPRLKIVSEKDKGPADAFSRALTRCKGEILASCLADEELMPNTLSRVVEIFNAYPHLGAITGDAHVSDIDGNIYAKFTGAPFNILNYLNGEYCPYWCSSFFSMSALRFVGIFDKRWSRASLEFEIWCRLAMETDILYVPEIFSKYAHHADQLSQAGDRVEEELEARIDIIRKHMFGRGKYFGEDYGLRDAFILMQLINLHRHLSVWNEEEAEKTYQRIVNGDYLAEFNAERAAVKSLEAPTTSKSADHIAVSYKQTSIAEAPPTSISPTQSTKQKQSKRSNFVPMHEYILPRQGIAGRVYQKLTPVFVRKLVPRGLKIRLAQIIGARGK